MKTTLAHLVAYVVAGLTTLAAFNPDTVTALVGPKAGAYAAAFITLCGALVAFIHSVSPSKAAVATTAKLLIVALYVGSMGYMLTGCAQVSAFVSSPTGQETLADAIPVAVLVAEGQGVPAATIKTICADALAADSGTSVTLGTLTNDMNATLSKLNTADKEAIGIVEVALNAAINAKLAGNKTVATLQAVSSGVFTACVQAAN